MGRLTFGGDIFSLPRSTGVIRILMYFVLTSSTLAGFTNIFFKALNRVKIWNSEYLVADLSLKASEPAYAEMEATAWIMIVLWGVGVPLLLTFLVLRRRVSVTCSVYSPYLTTPQNLQ